jgi:hypothetical protein
MSAAGQRRVGVGHVAADGDAVHDREEAGGAQIRLLLPPRVREQPRDGRGARGEAGGRARAYEGVDPAIGQHRLQRLAWRDHLHVDAGRQRERRALPARAPGDRARVHAVLLPQDAAHPERGGLLVLRRADVRPARSAGAPMPRSVRT